MRDKVNVHPTAAVIQVDPVDQLHFSIVNADIVFAPVVLEDQDVVAHLADYVKVCPAAVLTFGLGIIYPL